jgi:hypothetical protein
LLQDHGKVGFLFILFFAFSKVDHLKKNNFNGLATETVKSLNQSKTSVNFQALHIKNLAKMSVRKVGFSGIDSSLYYLATHFCGSDEEAQTAHGEATVVVKE